MFATIIVFNSFRPFPLSFYFKKSKITMQSAGSRHISLGVSLFIPHIHGPCLPRRRCRMTTRPAASESQKHKAPEPLDVQAAAEKFGWEELDPARRRDFSGDRQVQELPVAAIRRPLGRVRSNSECCRAPTRILEEFFTQHPLSPLTPFADQEKVEVLKKSIQEIGLLEPIDVLEVEGVYYGFSGCHRFQAHQELGKETILCRVRKATPQVLKYHMM